jgi:hypothetical protein
LNCLITLRQLEQGSSSVNIFIAPVEETLAQVTVPSAFFTDPKSLTICSRVFASVSTDLFQPFSEIILLLSTNFVSKKSL